MIYELRSYTDDKGNMITGRQAIATTSPNVLDLQGPETYSAVGVLHFALNGQPGGTAEFRVELPGATAEEAFAKAKAEDEVRARLMAEQSKIIVPGASPKPHNGHPRITG